MRGSTPPAPPGYELLQPIGHGASSVVWRAVQLSTGRPVALKILDADVSDADAARRFGREREIMAGLAVHPGIVTIYDAGVHEGRPWLALELCRRGSLASHVGATGPMSTATAFPVLVRLADALSAAHAHSVLHCDVKPANVMLTDHGEPALGDFGIARVTVGRATTTTVGGFSLDHVAPELLDDEKSSERSDVYSLGTTVWELLAGHPPFRRTGDVSVGTVIKRIMTQPLPDLPDVPSPVLALLRDMTAKDPDARIGTMGDVARRTRELARELDLPLHTDLALPPIAALDEQLDEGPTDDGAATAGDATVHRRRPVGDSPAPAAEPPPRRRRHGPLAAAIAAVLALVVGVGVLVVRPWAAPGADADTAPRVDVLAQTSAPTAEERDTAPSLATPAAVPSPTSVSGDLPTPATDAPRVPRSRTPSRTSTTARSPAGSTADARPPAVPAAPVAPAAEPAAQAPADDDPEPDPEPPSQKPPVKRSDGASCYGTAIRGGLVLGENQQHNAGGPNFTSAACNAIHIRLTSAVYRTYARSCLETASGSGITSCSAWKLLSYPDTWDTLSTGVPAGTRWQIQMYAEGPESATFSYTA